MGGAYWRCRRQRACMQAPDLGQTMLRFQGNTMQAMYHNIAGALAATCEPGTRDTRRPQVCSATFPACMPATPRDHCAPQINLALRRP